MQTSVFKEKFVYYCIHQLLSAFLQMLLITDKLHTFLFRKPDRGSMKFFFKSVICAPRSSALLNRKSGTIGPMTTFTGVLQQSSSFKPLIPFNNFNSPKPVTSLAILASPLCLLFVAYGVGAYASLFCINQHYLESVSYFYRFAASESFGK